MQFKLKTTLQDIPEESWSQIAPSYFPFARYEFLRALEKSGCVGPDSGWVPCYLCAYQNGALVGASLIYLKYNSYGEYIFDWNWVEAYQQHGYAYYPKLLSAIPFTPATVQKLMIHPQADFASVAEGLIQKALELCDNTKASSLHFLFLHPQEVSLFTACGFLIRRTFQYHWTNRDYINFEHFLSDLKGRKAKQIRKERRVIEESGIQVRLLTAGDLTAEHAKLFYQMYRSTIEKKEAIAYLNENFFAQVFLAMPDAILLCVASLKDQWLGASLSFYSKTHLYGRYWGALAEYNFLHFELCYYQLIDFAIDRKVQLFEAGAQGEHKIQRGFLPQETLSAHLIQSPAFSEAIKHSIQQEAIRTKEEMQALNALSPFRESPPCA